MYYHRSLVARLRLRSHWSGNRQEQPRPRRENCLGRTRSRRSKHVAQDCGTAKLASVLVVKAPSGETVNGAGKESRSNATHTWCAGILCVDSTPPYHCSSHPGCDCAGSWVDNYIHGRPLLRIDHGHLQSSLGLSGGAQSGSQNSQGTGCGGSPPVFVNLRS